MRKVFFAIISLILIFSAKGYSQYYVDGTDPASINWIIIKTEHFRIIFPDFYEQQARRTAGLLESSYKASNSYSNTARFRIPVVLHPQSAYSNAFAAWVPKRMEYLTCPPPSSLSAQEWLEQLSLHETRHAIQMNILRNGFTRALEILLGEQAIGPALLYANPWILEGDACLNETRLSNSGRGRMPWFQAEMKALTMQKGLLSYEKTFLGSYNYNIPDHYETGYLMVNTTNKLYNNDKIWERALENAGNKPWSITPISTSLYRQTFLRKEGLYRRVFSHLRDRWIVQTRDLKNYNPLSITDTTQKNTWYAYPTITEDNSILALKSSFDNIPKFILISQSGNEKFICNTSNMVSNNYSYAKNQIVWAELKLDPRWDNRNYSNIAIYNIDKQTKRFITKNKRYYSPVITKDGSKIAAVEVTKDEKSTLVIFDLNKDTEKTIYQCTHGTHLLTPAWNDDKHISFITMSSQGKNILRINTETFKLDTILKAGFADISELRAFSDTLIFNGSWTGNPDVYTIIPGNKEPLRLTYDRYQAKNAYLSKNRQQLIFTSLNYSSSNIIKMPITWNTLSSPDTSMATINATLLAPQANPVVFDTSNSTKLVSKRYSKLLHLFNFHSWQPGIGNDKDLKLKFSSLTLHSQNTLSTAITTLRYEKDPITKNTYSFAGLTYSGWYPQFDIEAETQTLNDTIGDENNQTSIPYKYRASLLSAIISIPIKYTSNEYTTSWQPYYKIGFENYSQFENLPFSVQEGTRNISEFGLLLQNKQRKAFRNLTPQYAQELKVAYKNSFNDYLNAGSIMAVKAKLTFPGLLKNHGFITTLAFQQATPNQFIQSSIIDFPIGYTTRDNKSLTLVSLNYLCPLFYPDLRIAELAYIKRIRTNFFYNYAIIEEKYYNKKTDLCTMGVDLITDTHFFRLPFPVEIGVRTIHYPYATKYKTSAHLIFNITPSF